ncbi:MAG: hypothetical protein ACRDA4_01250 [Filifactoraceae bacterium]
MEKKYNFGIIIILICMMPMLIFATDNSQIKVVNKINNDEKTHKIIASSSYGGTIDPSGKVMVNENESKTYIISPIKGYKVKSVFVNGEYVGVENTYKFSHIKNDIEIEALFEKVESKIDKNSQSEMQIAIEPVAVEDKEKLFEDREAEQNKKIFEKSKILKTIRSVINDLK